MTSAAFRRSRLLVGKEIDSPRRVSTGCTPQLSGPAMLPPEGALIAKALTLQSEGAADLDYRSQDRTSLNNRSICTQLAHSVRGAHPSLLRTRTASSGCVAAYSPVNLSTRDSAFVIKLAMRGKFSPLYSYLQVPVEAYQNARLQSQDKEKSGTLHPGRHQRMSLKNSPARIIPLMHVDCVG